MWLLFKKKKIGFSAIVPCFTIKLYVLSGGPGVCFAERPCV